MKEVDTTDAPRRRVRFNLRLQADSWDDVSKALLDLSTEVALGNWRGPNGASGGPGAGYTIESDEDETVTHDSYFEALNEYLARERRGV